MERFQNKKASTLIEALLHHTQMKRGTLKKKLASGAVHVDGKRVQKATEWVPAHATVEFGKPQAKTSHGLKIVFENAEFWIVDKPCSLLSVSNTGDPTPSVISRLQKDAEAFVVHRLDRETSGLLIVAKTEQAQAAFTRGWAGFEKEYLACVKGTALAPSGTIDRPLRAANKMHMVVDEKMRGSYDAITHYRTLLKEEGRTFLSVTLETGRKHQIRVHFESLGAALIGDKRYGEGAGRLMLHAHRLCFSLNDKAFEFEAALPPEFRVIARQLRADLSNSPPSSDASGHAQPTATGQGKT